MAARGAAGLRLDGTDFRRAMGQFATGVAVVTVGGLDGPYGTTVNSLSSVSLVPPLLLICLESRARGAEIIGEKGQFTVNILAARQEHLARRFADRRRECGPAAFDDVPHHRAPSGAPVFTEALARVDCHVERQVCAGDHTIFLSQATHVTVTDAATPLTFFRGRLLTES